MHEASIVALTKAIDRLLGQIKFGIAIIVSILVALVVATIWVHYV